MEYLTFYNGEKMPMLGLGLFLALNHQELEDAINVALETGYRHFDTAYMYRNEAVLGKVLKEWISAGKVKREELFITTKLPLHGNHPDRVEHFMKKSLEALQLEYVDLYLVHTPVSVKYISDDQFAPKDENGDILLDTSSDLESVWKKMEEQVTAGRAKSIGVSNYNIRQLHRIMKVEVYLYFQQKELREVCKKYNITIVAYGPLGSPGRTVFYESMGMTGFKPPTVLDDPTVAQLATKYGKSSPHILLRFLIQLGLATIPKSTTPARVKQNFDVFDFKINDDDMNTLIALDKGEVGRSFKMDAFKGIDKHPEYPMKF